MNIEQVTAQEHPIVAFSDKQKDIRQLDALPRWAGITGEDSRDRFRSAVEAFNRGELDGIALTFGVGSTGIRLHGAKTLAFIGRAPANVMHQAEERALGANAVFL